MGKWHCGSVEPRYHPNARGFEEFVGFRAGWNHYFDYRLDWNGTLERGDGTYLTDVFTDRAVGFVERHRNEPFYLHLAYSAPHFPLEVPDEDLRPFAETGRHTDAVARIYAMIRRMDAGIGRLLETLDRLGLRENTIVMFTSDNGPQFGGEGEECSSRFNCGFRGAKGSVHESGIRVPLAIRWPAGLDGGRHFHDLVHFTDWFPTLCGVAGVAPPDDRSIDGTDILPALRGEGAAKLATRRFWQWSRAVPVPTHNAAMRDGDWKLVRPGTELANTMTPLPGWERDLALYQDVDFHPEKYIDGVPEAQGVPPCVGVEPDPPLLFNLANDPIETTDLAARHPDRVSRMLRDLETWFEEVEAERRRIA